jgi:two-component system response regulator
VHTSTILLVEDNPDHQELCLRALKAADIIHVTRVVGGAEEALDYLYGRGAWSDRDTRALPSLVLVDLKLGRMDGFELMRALRAEHRFRHLPLVVLTSSCNDEDIRRAYEAGANGYIRKPVDFDEFVDVLKAAAEFWIAVNVPSPDPEK